MLQINTKWVKKVFILAVILIIILVFLLIMVSRLYYQAMVNDSDELMQEAANIFLGQVDPALIRDNKLNVYNHVSRFSKYKIDDFTLERLHVIHDFKDGYIWIRYTLNVSNENGEPLYGSYKINSRWKMHKENGKWKVVEIKEKP